MPTRAELAQPEKWAEYQREWRRRNPDSVRATKRRYNTKNSFQWQQRRFGITESDYNAMLAEQGGTCAVCLLPPGGERLAIDHNHETGAIRGLLHQQCNLAVGHLADDPERARRLAAYLEKYASHV